MSDTLFPYTSEIDTHTVFARLQKNASIDEVFDLVHERCLRRKVLIATAESCTSGLVAAELGARPGSSAFLYGAWVVYSNHAKNGMLEVSPYDIRDFGAVSEEVARSMLRGVFAQSPVSHAISITGIAGPSGGTAQKPVGTVWIGAAGRARPGLLDHEGGTHDTGSGSKAILRRYRFDGDRSAVRHASTRAAGLLLLELLALEDNAIDMLHSL
jgi:PncC family amidohydrolase